VIWQSFGFYFGYAQHKRYGKKRLPFDWLRPPLNQRNAPRESAKVSLDFWRNLGTNLRTSNPILKILGALGVLASIQRVAYRTSSLGVGEVGEGLAQHEGAVLALGGNDFFGQPGGQQVGVVLAQGLQAPTHALDGG
jgi:hypothetical protein